MEAVVLLDQRMSRAGSDRVDVWAERLNERYAAHLTRLFVRTAGDEMQGLTPDAAVLVGIVMDAVEDGGWWIGVGIGDVERPLGRTTRESRGTAFWLAREALTKAKSRRATRPLVLRGDSADATKELSAALLGLAFIILRRTRRQREVAVLYRGGLSVGQIAERQSMTPQTIRELLQAAGAEEEHELRELAIALASRTLR